MLEKVTKTLPQLGSYCDPEGIDVLVSLGLSSRQSRVYLALVAAGSCGAKIIARLAGVPRQEVYGLLSELQQLGLVNQNLTVPISYTPLPLQDTLKLLLEQKTNDLNIVTHKAKILVNRLNTPPLGAINLQAKPCFGVVSQGKSGNKQQVEIEKTQHSIDALTSWVRFKQICFHFEQQIIEAVRRKVMIRIITDKPPNHQIPNWVNTTCNKHDNFQLKIFPTTPEVIVTIFDHKKIALAYNPNSRLTKGPDLWSSHPAFLAAYQAYFDMIWKKWK